MQVNLRTAEQGIRGVDMARESTSLADAQILTQAGNTMLAQANQLAGSSITAFRIN